MKAGWSTLPLGELCSIEMGATPPRANASYFDPDKTTTNVWLSIADISASDGRTIASSREHLSALGAARVRVVKAGTLLVSFKLSIGKLAFAGCDLRTNEAIAALRIRNNRQLDQEYLYWALRHFDWDSAAEADQKVKGRTLNKDKLTRIPVSLPADLAEQRRIVEVLDEAFAGLATATANAEQTLANARELFESFLSLTIARLHEHVPSVELKSVCKRITVGHVGPMASSYQSEGITFLRSQNVRPFVLNLNDVKFISGDFDKRLAKSRLKPGDVAIVRTGYPGTAAVIPTTLVEANCADLVIVTPQERLMPDFLVLFLNSAVGKELVLGKLVGAAQKHFNVGAAKHALIPLPEPALQATIVAGVSTAMKETERVRSGVLKKLTLLAELKASLLHRAFAGELV